MLELIIKIIIVSASGALAPGPLTAATATAGLKKGWRAGIETSIGHTIVELPLVILLSVGFITLLKNPEAHFWLGLLGSVFLLYFGIITMKESFSKREAKCESRTPTPIITGIVLTALNPYFLAWWIGIGSSLIPLAIGKAGWFGIGILYIFHVWLDYAWLSFIAAISSLGRLKTTVYRIILFALGSMVIYLGVSMMIRIL